MYLNVEDERRRWLMASVPGEPAYGIYRYDGRVALRVQDEIGAISCKVFRWLALASETVLLGCRMYARCLLQMTTGGWHRNHIVPHN